MEFESALERDWIIALDADPTIVDLRAQPFTLTYDFAGRSSRYTPDLLAQRIANESGEISTSVYEVKPKAVLDELSQKFEPRFEAATKYCEERGWSFAVVTDQDIRSPFVQNAKFLRSYRNVSEDVTAAKCLRYTMLALGETSPEELLIAAYWDPAKRMAAISQLWKMIERQEIGAVWHQPLTMRTPIWLTEN